MTDYSYSVIPVLWQTHKNDLQLIRRIVFIEEQQVPAELEWDELDEDACHILALDSGNHPVGTGRLLDSGQIGRMAVLPGHRYRGIGSNILATLLEVANARNLSGLFLHAQIRAIPFYRKHGFIPEGDHFDDAGIVHCRMIYPDR